MGDISKHTTGRQKYTKKRLKVLWHSPINTNSLWLLITHTRSCCQGLDVVAHGIPAYPEAVLSDQNGETTKRKNVVGERETEPLFIQA